MAGVVNLFNPTPASSLHNTTSAKSVSKQSAPTTVQTVTQPIYSTVPSYTDVISQARTISNENTAKAQELAEKEWQFNQAEAQKNRDWQEYMSNTAHQREVADLLAAGLNPILSANAGASVGSGAAASGSSANVDTSANSIIGNYINSLISSATAINTANINAKANLGIAEINRQSAQTVADIGRSASMYNANISRANALSSKEVQEAYNEIYKILGEKNINLSGAKGMLNLGTSAMSILPFLLPYL